MSLIKMPAMCKSFWNPIEQWYSTGGPWPTGGSQCSSRGSV